MGIAFPDTRQSACARFRFRYSECDRCASVCPHEAIRLADDGIGIDTARCQNCGLCVAACRTGAVTSDAITPIDWVRKAVAAGAASFACPRVERPGAQRVPCLAALDASVLAYLSRRNVPAQLWGADQCERCPHGERGAALLALNLEAVEALARETTDPAQWLAIDLPHAPQSENELRPARRQLFRRLIGRAVDAATVPREDPEATVPVPEKAIRAGPYHLPEVREVLNIVRRNPARADRPANAHPSLPTIDLRLDAGCTHCEACFRACPTGALQIVESADAWSLEFSADRCVGCEVCLEVCQPQVLGAAPSIPSPDSGWRPLHRLGKQRCQRCDRPFVSATPDEHCPICADDADVFDEIFG